MKTINRQHIWLSLLCLLLAAQVFTLVWIWKHPCTPPLVAISPQRPPVTAPTNPSATDSPGFQAPEKEALPSQQRPASPVLASAAAVKPARTSAYRSSTTDKPEYSAPEKDALSSQQRPASPVLASAAAAKPQRAQTSVVPAPSLSESFEDPNNPLPPGHRPNAVAERNDYPRQPKNNQPVPATKPVTKSIVQQPLYPVAHYSRF